MGKYSKLGKRERGRGKYSKIGECVVKVTNRKTESNIKKRGIYGK